MTDQPTRNLHQPGAGPESEHPTQRLIEPRGCLRCGQPMLTAEAATRRPYVLAVSVRVEVDPGILAPHYAWSRCSALVCPRCGYTELYTLNPQALEGGAP